MVDGGKKKIEMVVHIILFFKKKKGKYKSTVDPYTLHLFATKQ